MANMRFDILANMDSKEAADRVDELRLKLEQVSDLHIKGEIDDAELKAQIREIKGELDALADKHPDVKIRASAARALMDLREVKAEARELDGKNVNVHVDDDGTTSLFTGNTRLLIAAGLAIGPAIAAGVAPGIAALAAGAATAGAFAQGLGVLAISFSGISAGVKELGNDQTATAGKAEQSAAQQISSANSIANAQDSLRSAAQNVAVAQENAAQSVHQALEQEESAHLAVGQAVRREQDAELSLVDAQKAALRAQKDLTQAREDAERSLQDMAFSVQDNALAQRRAVIDLEQAQRNLANLDASDPRRAEAELSLAERQQRMTELQATGQRLAEDKAKADAAGVEGSKQVTSAQDALTQANQRVADSQQAIYDSALAITQAQQRERDAVDEVTRARVTGDRQVEAAHLAVIQTQRSLTSATAQQAAQVAATAASTGNLTKAMDDLSPAGQHFAHFLHDDVIPGLKGVRDGVQASLLPDMELSLRLLAQDAPIVTAGLQGTAAVIGDLSVRGARMMTSGPWQSDFALIMAANNRALMGWGNAGLSALDVARNLTAAAIPLELHFAGVAEKSLATFQAWVQGKRDSGELGVWFHEMQDVLSGIGHFLAQGGEAAWHLFQALTPLGGVTLELIGDLAQFVGWLAQTDPLLLQIALGAAALYPWVGRLGSAFSALGEIWTFLKGASVASALTSAGAAAEKATVWLTHSATAGAAVNTGFTTAAGAAGLLTAGLAVLGGAFLAAQLIQDHFGVNQDKVVSGLLKGGQAAEEVKRAYDSQGIVLDVLTGRIANVDGGLAKATEEMTKQLAAMDPLTRAQTLQARALNDMTLAHERQDWPAYAAAQADYARQSAEVTRQQQIQHDAITSVTEALREQQEQVLGLSDADIRYGDALQRATDSAKEHGRTMDVSTEHGRRNQEAFNDLVRAMAAQEEQMRRSGASEQALNATHEQHRVQLRNVATQMGLNQTAAQDLTNKYFGIPTSITTTFFAATPPAIAAVADMSTKIRDALIGIQDEAVTVKFVGAAPNDTNNILARATGGPILGPGTSTSDDIPLWASNDEHMWTAKEVHGAGGHGNVMRLRQLAALGKIPAFATGGPVTYSGTLNLFGDPGNVVTTNVDYVQAEIEKLKKTIAEVPAGPVGAGVARWAGMVDQALGIMHQPLTYEGITLRRMMQESGGNPTVVNKWDSNWQKGTPSVGLMQVISCVPLNTRILTREGWKSHSEVTVGDETIGFNSETGRSEWTRVKRVIHHDDAEVWSIGNGSWRAEVTPNHRWVSEPTRHRVERGTTCPECDREWPTRRGMETHLGRLHHKRLPAHRLVAPSMVMTRELACADRLRVAAEADTGEGIALSPNEVRIIAWLLGDGCLRGGPEHRNFSAWIYQSKPVMVEKIKDLLSDVPHTVRVRHRKAHYQVAHEFRIRSDYARELLKRSELLARGPECFVLALDPEQRAAFLDAMIDAEGNRQTTEKPGWREFVRITQRDGDLQDAIKLAVYLDGYRPSVSRLARYEDHHSPAANIGMCGPHVASNMFSAPALLDRQPVWCVETELGTWTMQQHGLPVLTGNSTYRANKVVDVGPYLYGVSVDPLANTLASMKYAIGRYGSLPAAYNKAGGYANGGIVDSPTMAMVGEAGPEAILPLNRPHRAGSIAQQAGLGGATVNVGPVHVHSDVDVDALAHRLAFSAASAGL
ncbi:MAG: hypothetical protein ACRDRX_04410 [Pseudonocardiaceae bacterium]